ncbi:MAG: hypothetical protein NC090_06765 [Anaeroplasma bactoclasticum]|nr:hypothetical protein [Anaeroplasma bactoclasticum]
MEKEINNLAKMQDLSNDLTRSLEANAEFLGGLSLLANDGNLIHETTLDEISQQLYNLKNKSTELTKLLEEIE